MDLNTLLLRRSGTAVRGDFDFDLQVRSAERGAEDGAGWVDTSELAPDLCHHGRGVVGDRDPGVHDVGERSPGRLQCSLDVAQRLLCLADRGFGKHLRGVVHPRSVGDRDPVVNAHVARVAIGLFVGAARLLTIAVIAVSFSRSCESVGCNNLVVVERRLARGEGGANRPSVTPATTPGGGQRAAAV